MTEDLKQFIMTSPFELPNVRLNIKFCVGDEMDDEYNDEDDTLSIYLPYFLKTYLSGLDDKAIFQWYYVESILDDVMFGDRSSYTHTELEWVRDYYTRVLSVN